MAKAKAEAQTFDPTDPSTWTWTALNEWVMNCNDTKALMAAIKVERSKKGGNRKNYLKRIYSRYRRLSAQEEAEQLGIPM